VCGEKHAPGKCDAFKKLSPQQRLKVIEERELCHLCYRRTCEGASAGQRTRCATAGWMAVKRPTTIFCTAHSWKAV
jgi:hypothetical protein